MSQPSTDRTTIIAGIALAISVVAVIVFAPITNTSITPATIRAALAQLDGWASLALIAALAGVLVIPILPASILQIGAGLFFGPWLGLVCVLIADCLGASVGFGLARFWGKSLLARFLSPAQQTQLANLTERVSWRGVIILRLLPGPAYPLVSFAAGYSSLRYSRYILASLVGVFPGLVLLVLAGDLVERSPLLAFALIAAILLGLVVLSRGLLDRKTSDKKETPAR